MTDHAPSPVPTQSYGSPAPSAPAPSTPAVEPVAPPEPFGDPIAAEASPAARARFIERTYLHLAGAIVAFVVLLTGAVNAPGIEHLVDLMLGSAASWAVVLFMFFGVSWLADHWARSEHSSRTQYIGLAVYTVAEVITFIPLVYVIRELLGSTIIIMAGAGTLAVFAAMTAYVFMTRKDFSFLRGILVVAGVGACGLVMGSLVFGYHLGLVFCLGMCVLAAGYILYNTSNVLLHYRTDQHVAAALTLFSAVALMFWYVLMTILELATGD